MIYKTLYRKLNIEQNEPHKNRELIPALQVRPVVFLLSIMKHVVNMLSILNVIRVTALSSLEFFFTYYKIIIKVDERGLTILEPYWKS
jgi:hypothetical protein